MSARSTAETLPVTHHETLRHLQAGIVGSWEVDQSLYYSVSTSAGMKRETVQGKGGIKNVDRATKGTTEGRRDKLHHIKVSPSRNVSMTSARQTSFYFNSGNKHNFFFCGPTATQ